MFDGSISDNIVQNFSLSFEKRIMIFATLNDGDQYSSDQTKKKKHLFCLRKYILFCDTTYRKKESRF